MFFRRSKYVSSLILDCLFFLVIWSECRQHNLQDAQKQRLQRSYLTGIAPLCVLSWHSSSFSALFVSLSRKHLLHACNTSYTHETPRTRMKHNVHAWNTTYTREAPRTGMKHNVHAWNTTYTREAPRTRMKHHAHAYQYDRLKTISLTPVKLRKLSMKWVIVQAPLKVKRKEGGREEYTVFVKGVSF